MKQISLIWLTCLIVFFACDKKASEQALVESDFYPDSTYNVVTMAYNDYLNSSDTLQIMQIYGKIQEEHRDGSREDQMILALIEHFRAKVLYDNYKDNEAINAFKRSAKFKEPFLPWSNPEYARSIHNVGYIYYDQKDYFKALEYFLKAASIPESLPSMLKVNTYKYISLCYKFLGDLDHAKSYLENAIAYTELEKNKEENKDSIKILWDKKRATLSIDMAALMSNWLKDPQAALPYATYSVNTLEKYNHNGTLSSSLSNAYHNMGMVQEMMDSLSNAIQYYEKCISIYENLGTNKSHQAKTFDNLGIVYKKLGQLDNAKTNTLTAWEYYGQNNDTPVMGFIFDNLADIYFLQNEIDSALYYYDLAMSRIVAGFEPKESPSNPVINNDIIVDKPGLQIYLSSKAHALEEKYIINHNLYDLELAYDAYLKLDSLADLMRSEYRSDASKENHAEFTKKLYEKSIDLCFELHEVTGEDKYVQHAFYFAEKSKAMILLEALQRSGIRKGLADELSIKERELHLKKSHFEKEYALANLMEARGGNALKWLDSLSKYRTLHEKIILEMNSRHPSFRNLRQAVPTISLSYIQDSMLEKEQNLIEYFQGDSMLYCFVIGKSDFHSFEIPMDSSFRQEMLIYNEAIHQMKIASYEKSAHALYQKLFKPIQSILQLNDQLIIIPDGLLSYLSFDALLSELPDKQDESDLRKYPYLIKEKCISYNYSAALYKQMSKKNSRNTQNEVFIAFAPEFAKSFAFEQEENKKMGKLEMNIPEAKEISKMMGGKTFLNNEANLTQFNKFSSQSKIIHLATHGQANPSDGDFSYILFSGEEKGKYEALYAKDLYSLEINADLVVLSACETHFGEDQKGEGVISLARGFAYAGVKSLCTSLWFANESSSKALSKHFYSSILNGEKKSDALRNAKLKYIDEQTVNRKAHPFYWAGYLFIGDEKALSF